MLPTTLKSTVSHFVKYELINISQMDRKQRNFQEKYWFFAVNQKAQNFNINKSEKKILPALVAGFIGVDHIKTYCSMLMNMSIFMKISQAKNHWSKQRHVCTHFDAISILNPNMDMKCNISEIYENFMKNWVNICAKKVYIQWLPITKRNCLIVCAV